MGYFLAAGPGSWSRLGGIGPGGHVVQVEHSPAPAVDGQRDTEDANDVHDDSCPCHVCNLEVSIGEDNGVWRRGNRQHKGKGGT